VVGILSQSREIYFHTEIVHLSAPRAAKPARMPQSLKYATGCAAGTNSMHTLKFAVALSADLACLFIREGQPSQKLLSGNSAVHSGDFG
jgi:hypothetical protein